MPGNHIIWNQYCIITGSQPSKGVCIPVVPYNLTTSKHSPLCPVACADVDFVRHPTKLDMAARARYGSHTSLVWGVLLSPVWSNLIVCWLGACLHTCHVYTFIMIIVLLTVVRSWLAEQQCMSLVGPYVTFVYDHVHVYMIYIRPH